MKDVYKICFLLSVITAGLIAAYLIPAFSQDASYHDFADQRSEYGIHNFWNVMSNIPLILFGLIGLKASSTILSPEKLSRLQSLYTLFFTAAILTGIGSAYYHLNPSNQSLVLDRLLMAAAFMAFFSIVVAENISLKAGRLLFLPLLAAGMVAVIYWYDTEQLGAGDLRPYAVAQFLPMILLPFILALYRNARQDNAYIWIIIAAYILSKLAEHFDANIFEVTELLSGHTLKHLLASLAVLFFYLHFNRQQNTLYE